RPGRGGRGRPRADRPPPQGRRRTRRRRPRGHGRRARCGRFGGILGSAPVRHAARTTGVPVNPRLMGIVNLNPDSFSTVGSGTGDAVASALALVAEGAEVIDLGAQSASPSTPVVPADEELAALEPVVAALAAEGVTVSVDTY